MSGRTEWVRYFALAVTVLISSYVVRIKTMWRQAPITAAIVIAAGISHRGPLPNNGLQERAIFDGRWKLLYREKTEPAWRQVNEDLKDRKQVCTDGAACDLAAWKRT